MRRRTKALEIPSVVACWMVMLLTGGDGRSFVMVRQWRKLLTSGLVMEEITTRFGASFWWLAVNVGSTIWVCWTAVTVRQWRQDVDVAAMAGVCRTTTSGRRSPPTGAAPFQPALASSATSILTQEPLPKATILPSLRAKENILVPPQHPCRRRREQSLPPSAPKTVALAFPSFVVAGDGRCVQNQGRRHRPFSSLLRSRAGKPPSLSFSRTRKALSRSFVKRGLRHSGRHEPEHPRATDRS
ncbi:hypothetical protein V8G54_010204 [Vigna mungo]|uniref:Transmembrane protein n=1 Tax=Vigna mungo TaxID=3915 RepID=A0AAQ3S4N0_VIGMU